MERDPNTTDDEIERAQDGRSTTNLTGAGGEAVDDADAAGTTSDRNPDDPGEAEETLIGRSAPGGSPPAFVAPPPGTTWPDPMGHDDDERELERRTR